MSTAPNSGDVQARHLRGSQLLLLGRVVSLLLNFGVQVLTVRVLTKTEYSAFSFALAATGLASTAALLGLNRGLARQAAILHELGDRAGLHAVVRRAFFLVCLSSGLLVLLVFAAGSERLVALLEEPLEVTLLFVLSALVPIQALDLLFQSLLSAFSSSFALFFRRQLLGPLLRLAAVAAVAMLGGGVLALSWGYIAGGLIGLGLCATVLRPPAPESEPDLEARASVPAPRRERGLLALSLPMFTTDLSFVLRSNAPVLLLAALRPPEEVADFRAALQLAALNLVVQQSLGLMFTPSAARLYARGDRSGLEEFYWRTTRWTSLFTFPVLCVTACFPGQVLALLFGEAYAGAGQVLVVLALGHVVSALFGPNVQLLEACGSTRSITRINVIEALSSASACALAAASFGALGAALTLAVSSLVQRLAIHGALVRRGRVHAFDPLLLRVHTGMALGAAAALAFGALGLPLAANLAFVGIAWLALMRANAHALDLGLMFPALARRPTLSRVLGLGARRAE